MNALIVEHTNLLLIRLAVILLYKTAILVSEILKAVLIVLTPSNLLIMETAVQEISETA